MSIVTHYRGLSEQGRTAFFVKQVSTVFFLVGYAVGNLCSILKIGDLGLIRKAITPIPALASLDSHMRNLVGESQDERLLRVGAIVALAAIAYCLALTCFLLAKALSTSPEGSKVRIAQVLAGSVLAAVGVAVFLIPIPQRPLPGIARIAFYTDVKFYLYFVLTLPISIGLAVLLKYLVSKVRRIQSVVQ